MQTFDWQILRCNIISVAGTTFLEILLENHPSSRMEWEFVVT